MQVGLLKSLIKVSNNSIQLPKELTPNPSRLLINLLSNPPMHIHSRMKIILPHTSSIWSTTNNITRTIPLPNLPWFIQSFIENWRRIDEKRFDTWMREFPGVIGEVEMGV
jgi:hypothetical protein